MASLARGTGRAGACRGVPRRCHGLGRRWRGAQGRAERRRRAAEPPGRPPGGPRDARRWIRVRPDRGGHAEAARHIRRPGPGGRAGHRAARDRPARPRLRRGGSRRPPGWPHGTAQAPDRRPGPIAGVGNAYSDEALHAARLSPFRPAGKLTEDEVARLHGALRQVLEEALARNEGVPAAGLKDEKRSAMRVHGRTGLPCPACGDTIREVAFADRSLQYCPTCQTAGKPLADRRLSRLLR